jgi:hypothetical protein
MLQVVPIAGWWQAAGSLSNGSLSAGFLAGAVVLALTGCAPSVGTQCDENAARTPYYRDGDGIPAYTGQAIMLAYCGFCHNDPGAFGVPQGLEFDATLVTATGEEGIAQARRLLARQATIHRHRDLIYQQVVGGHMPPRGFTDPAGTWTDEGGNPLPGIRDPRAHEMLRNWLACGSPVVERTSPVAMPCRDNTECVVTQVCTEMNQCLGVGDVVPARGTVDCDAPEATWNWIYACVFTRACAGAACHIGGSAGGYAMPDAATGYANTVGRGPGASSPSCTGAPSYVIAGDPDGSLLIHKLEGMDSMGAPVCGTRMPLTGSPLDPATMRLIRDWIRMGAPAM